MSRVPLLPTQGQLYDPQLLGLSAGGFDASVPHTCSESLALLRSPNRGRLFRYLWRGWGLFWLITAGLVMFNCMFWPWWFVGAGRPIADIALQVFGDESYLFYAGIVISYGCGFFASIIFALLYFKRHSIVPKSAADIVKSLLGGLPSGAIMISYTWAFTEAFPSSHVRAFARLFPCRWLDVDTLMPGIPVKAACLRAAADCMFAFVFVSSKYIHSDICQDEFAALHVPDARGNVKRNVILVAPDVAEAIHNPNHIWYDNPVLARIRCFVPHRPAPDVRVIGAAPPPDDFGTDDDALMTGGHTGPKRDGQGQGPLGNVPRAADPVVGDAADDAAPETREAYKIKSTPPDMLRAAMPVVVVLRPDDIARLHANEGDFALWLLVATITLQHVFRTHTPLVFDRWVGTASLLCGRSGVWVFGLGVLAMWMPPLAFTGAGAFFHSTEMLAVVYSLYGFLLLFVAFLVRSMFWGLAGTLHNPPFLPEPAALLVVLYRIGVIPCIPVSSGGMHPTLLSTLASVGVIRLVPLAGSRDRQIAFISADHALEIPERIEQLPQHVFVVLWRRPAFDVLMLAQSLRNKWVSEAPDGRGLDFTAVCTLVLLFALRHRSLTGTMAGLHASSGMHTPGLQQAN